MPVQNFGALNQSSTQSTFSMQLSYNFVNEDNGWLQAHEWKHGLSNNHAICRKWQMGRKKYIV